MYTLKIFDNNNAPREIENLSREDVITKANNIMKALHKNGYTNRIGDGFFWMIPGRWAQYSFHIFDEDGNTVTKELLEPNE